MIHCHHADDFNHRRGGSWFFVPNMIRSQTQDFQSLVTCAKMVIERTVKQRVEVSSMSQVTVVPDVLTLEEAANYLRLPRETIERQAAQGQIPGRRIEDTWRFLRAAIDDWLRSYDSRTLLLQQAGALANDRTLHELRAAIYTERGRPEAEEGAES